MLIPIIEKDPGRGDFTCRDGEIEILVSQTDYDVRFALEAALPYPTANIRVPLQSGDGPKCSLMLSGEASRVDATSADRITQAIVAKAAEAFADIMADSRASGLFMLPFRAFSLMPKGDGFHSLPSAQAILLPCDFPPHPEITSSHVDDDGATISLRIPVRPQRLITFAPEDLAAMTRTYVSRSLWVPDAKEISGSLGSVRSAAGGSAMGIRFTFMSESRMKGAVAAPDKYYRYIGNDSAGYHITSEIAPRPDYSAYSTFSGAVVPFPAAALIAKGSDADPTDWIADWRREGDGYLPADMTVKSADPLMAEMQAMTGFGNWLLTRPMTFASDSQSRRHAEATAIKSLRVYGVRPGVEMLGVLLGSADGRSYEPIMTFSPAFEAALLAPRRPFWRLLLGSSEPFPELCLEVT